MSLSDKFGRYQSLVEDFPAFIDASSLPLPLSLWRNSLRFSEPDFDRWFKDLKVQNRMASVDWSPLVYRIHSYESIEFLSSYLCGLIHTQEEIGMLPVTMLNPKPGERVLDLCAAPGNKMAAIAATIGDSGTVVGNDISRNRLGLVSMAVDRLGLTNVVLTSEDASSFPPEAGHFDKILVDAPCSCEGTTRKQPNVLDNTTPAFRNRLVDRQRRILSRALDLCRPGGRIVYSTCTYAPEECECVVADVLETSDVGANYSISSVSIPGLNYSNGLTEWDNKSLPGEMTNAIRVYPHQNDTGGFFAVALDRMPQNLETSNNLDPENSEPNSRWRASEINTDDFLKLGLPSNPIDQFFLSTESRKYYSLYSSNLQAPPAEMCFSKGVKAINVKSQVSKLSTAGCLLLGSQSESAYELNQSQLIRFLRRESINIKIESSRRIGTTLVSYRGKTVGRAAIREQNGVWILESHYPKSFSGVDVKKRLDNLDLR